MRALSYGAASVRNQMAMEFIHGYLICRLFMSSFEWQNTLILAHKTEYLTGFGLYLAYARFYLT